MPNLTLAVLPLLSGLIFNPHSTSDSLTTSASAFYAAKSATSTYTVQRVGEASVEYHAELAKPNKLRLESPAQVIVADGKSIVTFSKSDKTYDKRPETDAELKVVLSSNETLLLAPFFDASFTSRFAGIAGAGKKNRKGVTYDAVAGTAGGKTFTFYIDPADNLAKAADVSPTGGGLSDTIIVSTKELVVDAKVDDARFTFAIPAGATNVSADAPLAFPRDQMPNMNGYKTLPAVGLTSCCPTASSDVLAWLSMNGCDNLAPEGTAVERANWIAHELAEKYYKTDTIIGTTWDNMFAGLPLFLKDRGYGGSTLSIYSMVSNPAWKINHVSTTIPDLDVIKRACTRNSVVLAAVGWYNNPDSAGRCTRAVWHWAAVVDVDPDSGVMTLNDPFQSTINPQGYSLHLHYTRLPGNSKWILAGSPERQIPDFPAANVPVLEKYPNCTESQFAIVEGVLIVKVAK